MKILTINLCTSWTASRKSRMLQVRQFIEDNGIDVVLFQEGLQVCWPIYNSLRNLCPEDWWCYSKGYVGFPWFCSWRVGVLSRYPIVSTASLGCEVPQTAWLDAIPYPGRKRVVAVTVDVPGLGIATLVSVHLTSSPKTEAARQAQFLSLANWMLGLPPRDVTILGGDFNADISNPAFKAIFSLGLIHTATVSPSSPDYILTGGGAKVIGDKIVFTDHVVSDHVGVVAEVEK